MIAHVVKPLLRNKLIVATILIEIALIFSIVTNSAQIVSQMLATVTVKSGVGEGTLIVAELLRSDGSALTASDITSVTSELTTLPNVKAVGMSNSVPFGGDEWTVNVSKNSGQAGVSAAQYVVSNSAIDAMDLQIVEGRSFNSEEFVDFSGVVPPATVAIITEDLASRLAFTGSPLGKRIYLGDQSFVIVGIAESLARPNVSVSSEAQHSIMLPAKPSGSFSRFMLIGTEAHQSDLSIVRDTASRQGLYVRSLMSFAQVRDAGMGGKGVLLNLMVAVTLVSLSIGWLAVLALFSLWVRQRFSSYVTRRVLGATRRDILGLILGESQLVCIAGCVLGVVGALALNRLCIQVFNVQPLSGVSVLGCLALMSLICLLGTIKAATKASQVDLGETLKTLA